MNLLLTLPGEAELILIFIVLGILLIPFILFLINLQNLMLAVSPENRKMPPSNVWLMFIPLFNIVWQFIMVDKIAQSVTEECVRLQISAREVKATYNSGLAWCICNCLSFIPLLGGLAALVTFILYWVKTSEYKSLLIANKHNFMLDAEKKMSHQ